MRNFGKRTATYKRLFHGFSDFIVAIRVDLLEELVERCVSLKLLIFLLFLDIGNKLVPVASVMGRGGVLVDDVFFRFLTKITARLFQRLGARGLQR